MYTLPSNSFLVGKTPEKAYIRSLTGVILMALTRSSGEKIDYPEPETVINEGDTFLLIGEADELSAFDQLAKGKIRQLPKENDSSAWVLVPENSAIAGKTLAELNFDQQFGILVQAIRRKGIYIRFPDGRSKIEAKDHLLLFGSLELLTEISQKIISKENVSATISR
jgi:CPA2 family monovalent cation:H+ antiporter-2